MHVTQGILQFCALAPDCLTKKKGLKMDPLCFMSRSNLTSEARILVERFKMIHNRELTSTEDLSQPPADSTV